MKRPERRFTLWPFLTFPKINNQTHQISQLIRALMISQAQLLRAAFQYLRVKTEMDSPAREQKASVLLAELLTLVLLRNRNPEIDDSYPWRISDDAAEKAKLLLMSGGGDCKPLFFHDPASNVMYLSWLGMERITAPAGSIPPEDLMFLGHKGMVMNGLALPDLVGLNDKEGRAVAELIASYLGQFEIRPR